MFYIGKKRRKLKMACDVCGSDNNVKKYNLALVLEPAELYVAKNVISLCPDCYERLCLVKLVNKIVDI